MRKYWYLIVAIAAVLIVCFFLLSRFQVINDSRLCHMWKGSKFPYCISIPLEYGKWLCSRELVECGYIAFRKSPFEK